MELGISERTLNVTKPTGRFARKGDFPPRIVGEEAVLVPGHGGGDEDSIYTLNDVGAAIWKLIEPHRDAPGIGRPSRTPRTARAQ